MAAEVEQTIEIQDGIVSIFEKTISRRVALTDFIAGLERRVPVTLPTVARTQVFSHWDETDASNKIQLILSEISPGIRTITKRAGSTASHKRYRLGVPWTYFWFKAVTSGSINDSNWIIDSARVFFSNQRYSNPTTKNLIPAYLPNLYADGRVCWGSTGASHSSSLADQIDERVNGWYLSDFNSDLDRQHLYPYGEATMRRWVQESAENPVSWQNWPEWNSNTVQKYSVEELIRETIGHDVTPLYPVFNASVVIPEIPIPASYGRWEQFWNTVPAEERSRGQIALQNAISGDANFVPEVTANVIDFDDDGGENV